MDHRTERERVVQLTWVPCCSPNDLTPSQVDEIIQLFLQETEERYAEASLRHLPIPVWGGTSNSSMQTHLRPSPFSA